MVRLISAAVLALAVSPGLISAEPFPEHRREQQQQQHRTWTTAQTEEGFAPSPDRARENAVHVFNAVHSAMRQWGSSLHHNGLGLIPATIPRGTTLYHGSRSNSTPDGLEWLAFEAEHSEGFARSFRGGRGSPAPRPPGETPGKGRGPPIGVADARDEGQVPMMAGSHGDRDAAVRGYFHTYRANRDLRLLYVDGMAAGKTDMGTLDTQDFLLRGLQAAPGFGEYERARDLCSIVTKWGLDGVIRMEVGFEAIYCDFFSGLDFLGALRRPWNDQIEGERGGIGMFEWARAVGQRYDGIGAGRVRLDWSGVVSGFWYPLDVRNPEREDMPRLGTVTDSQREVILGRVREVLERGPREGKVDWQGVVDLIVSRHADRIEALADEEGDEEGFVSQALVVTNTFVDYPRDASDAHVLEDEVSKTARERCATHFLTPARVWRDLFTPEDELVYAAVEEVTTRICGDIFAVRGLLVGAAPKLASSAFSEAGIREVVAAATAAGQEDDDDERLGDAVKAGRAVYQKLKKDLDWSVWKKCKPGCGVAEVCFVAMWPFGLREDHYHPSCRNRTAMTGRRAGPGDGESYWSLKPRG